LNNDFEIVKVIFEKMDLKYEDQSLFALACEHNNNNIIKLLMPENNFGVVGGSENPLYYIIKNGNTEILKILAEKDNCDFNITFKNRKNILTYCLEQNNFEVIKIVINHPKIVQTISDTSLLISKGDLLNVLLPEILSHKNITIENINNFFIECLKSNFVSNDVITLLLDHVNINYQDAYGDTPLMICYDML